MKNFILTLTLLFSFLSLSFTQTVYPINLFNQGLQTTFTKYNELGNIKGTIISTFSNVVRSGLNTSVASTTNFLDASSNLQLSRDFGYKLNTTSTSGSQSFFIDMKYFLPFSVALQYKNYTVTATGNAYEIPSQLAVGMILNSVRINFNFTPNVVGFSSATTTVNLLNRTVQIREKISTPAGTYNCWKITEDCEIKTNTITKQKITRWVSNDFGVVKVEIRDTSGNLLESEVLTRFQLPSLSNSK